MVDLQNVNLLYKREKLKMRKSPKAARDANPENAERKRIRERNKMLDVPKGKTPHVIKHEYKDGKPTGKKTIMRGD